MPFPADFYTLSPAHLLADLYCAYYGARRHKASRPYQLFFQAGLDDNLKCLAAELFERRYTPRPSTCFVISDPKLREVFAADFRDRIVHHLFFNYTHRLFERTFIADSYSCIRGRGTHYGIERLRHHIASVSQSYTRPAYVLKVDIRGYFMSISRSRLEALALETINRMARRRALSGCPFTWGQLIDVDFVSYLASSIIRIDPTVDCRRLGRPSDWERLPDSKSLFFSPAGCGLPIGNLTSQLFSNVYLNPFDQFMKRDMHCQHYGRYVDDAYVVSHDRQWLLSLVPVVRSWLLDNLGLTLHEGKTRLCDVRQGVDFLGAFIKPNRTYVSNRTLERMERKLISLNEVAEQTLPPVPIPSADLDPDPFALHLRNSLSSFGGVLSHYASFRLRRDLFSSLPSLWRFGHFDPEFRKFIL